MTARVPGGRIASALALLVLLGASLLPIANAEAAAWRFDHGHITLSGVIPEHDHPWDTSAHRGHVHDHGQDHSTDGDDESQAEDVVFSLDDQGTPSVAPATGPRLPVMLGEPREVAVRLADRLAGVPPRVEAPPPRG